MAMRIYITILKLRKEIPWMVGMRRLRLATFRLLLLSPPTPSGSINQPKVLVAGQSRLVVITANIPVNRKYGR
jgi:hypothetical protein